MRLVACCCWYDEDPAWIRRYVEGLAQAGVTHLVALDGAYAAYPSGAPKSDLRQAVAFMAACRRAQIAATVRFPDRPWAGNEVGKRDAVIQLALAITEPTDWLLVLDVDEWITGGGDQLYESIRRTDLYAATIPLRERGNAERASPDDAVDTWPRLMRATPGLRVVGRHWIHRPPEGPAYWGPDGDQVPTLETELVVDHMTRHRAPARRQQQRDYIQCRELANFER